MCGNSWISPSEEPLCFTASTQWLPYSSCWAWGGHFSWLEHPDLLRTSMLNIGAYMLSRIPLLIQSFLDHLEGLPEAKHAPRITAVDSSSHWVADRQRGCSQLSRSCQGWVLRSFFGSRSRMLFHTFPLKGQLLSIFFFANCVKLSG